MEYRWTVVPEPTPDSVPVITMDAADTEMEKLLFAGDPDLILACGACRKPLMTGVGREQFERIVFKCWFCGAHNAEPLEPVLPSELVNALGRVAVNATRLEVDVVGTLWAALGHPEKVPKAGIKSDVATAPDDATSAIRDLKRVAQKRLHGSLLTEFRDWLSRAAAALSQRSRMVHGVWQGQPDERGRHRCVAVLRAPNPLTGKPNEDRWSVDDVDDLGRELAAVRHELIVLADRLRTAIPEMQPIVPGRPFPDALADGVA